VTDAEWAFCSVHELGRRLRAGEVTAVDLAGYFLDRLEKVALPLNAVAAITPGRALDEAALLDAELACGLDRGPLHGIPYGLKDIIAAPGVATTWGAAPFRDQVIDHESTVGERLRNAGAVLVGKLATVELAGGMGYEHPDASLTGAALNPWDTNTWTGGSSSGPAAATAAGAVPFSIGSDTGGSILMPAAWTGVTGLRATYGRVSRAGAMALCWSFDRLGPMCRSAEDCGLVLEAIAGPDPRDPSSLPEPYRYRGRPARRDDFRIGVLAGSFDGVQGEVRANFESAVASFREMGKVEEVELPDFPYAEVAEVIMAAEISAAFDEFLDAGGAAGLSDAKAHTHRLAATVLPARDYLRAQRIRRHMVVALDQVARPFDALIAPMLGTVATPATESFTGLLGIPYPQRANLASVTTGMPAISVPSGLGRGGLPTAVQLLGARLTENAVLDAACALEATTGRAGLLPSAFIPSVPDRHASPAGAGSGSQGRERQSSALAGEA
jgi:aspartyl-tRNA(Asn)/glutamyl-tRNA(Gln) amidotransferase subunit A